MTYNEGFNDGIDFANEVAFDLETRWRNSASAMRVRGTFSTGLFRRKYFVAKAFENEAKGIEAAANGIKAIREMILSRKKAP